MTPATAAAGLMFLWCLLIPQSGAVRESPASRPSRDAGVQAPGLWPLRPMRALLRSDVIERMEVLHVPSEVLTSLPIGPQDLERGYHYKVEYRWSAGAEVREELAAALAAVAITPTRDEGDLRWGCIFYDSSDARVLTMYFDRNGARGSVGEVGVMHAQPVIEVLERRFGSLWDRTALPGKEGGNGASPQASD